MSDEKRPIANDLPDVERRVEGTKSRKEHSLQTDNVKKRQEQGAVEEAIEKLPER